MRVYKFPFEKICKDNARIILYGMGNVGKQYLAQCKAAGNIEVLFAVDAIAELSYVNVHDVLVYGNNTLYELDESEFDYVVIAMNHDENAKFIKNSLVSSGIAEEKIIYSINYYDSVKNLRSPELYQWHNPSFSCFGEDLIVSGLFKLLKKENPSYLDVGCNHPYLGNNTAFLYLSGSSGINIDANPNCIELMNAERPDDVNLCMGVLGSEDGAARERDFYMLSEYDAVNSFSKSYIERYGAIKNLSQEIIKTIKISCVTLKEVIEKYCGGIFPDYFDLDIEGLDDEVIASYDFTDNGPQIICVESHSEAVCAQLLAQGYGKYFSTPHNVIFIKKELFDSIIKL